MLYYLFEYLETELGIPGAGLFQYISFRSGLAIILSLIISIVFGKRIISSLKRLQVGESVRDLGLEGQKEKEGTPTMGGVIIFLAIMVPTLLLADLSNIYIIIMLVSTVWLTAIGFADDYIKVFKKNKDGLKGRFKIYGQVGLGLLVGLTMLFHDDIVVRLDQNEADGLEVLENLDRGQVDVKTTLTNMPFIAENLVDYKKVLWFLGENSAKYVWLIFLPIVIFIITSVSNGANLTDGIDGLATGVSAIIAATLMVLAYVSSNTLIADYLNILYLPHTEELVVFSASFLGACVGFLWYNSYPAQVFMGDTGSLAIGGIIAALAILIRKELLIPILCGIFLIELLSVVMQVSYFKYSRKKYGEGRRIFRMSPLHHHYQKVGMHESKIVIRFWIIGILLAILTIITLKVR